MDIVARLRDPILFNFDAFDLCDEAADEIERLRAKIQKGLRPEGETIHGVIAWIKEEPDRLMQFRAALKESE